MQVARQSAAYSRNHERVRKVRGKATEHPCEHCQGPAREWATLHDRDGEDPADYIALCRKCHAAYDDLAGMVSRAMTGKAGHPNSPETREKMSERRRQYWQNLTPEQRAATRQKMSEGQRRRHAVASRDTRSPE